MLGEDFNLWSIQAVRKFLLDRSTQCIVLPKNWTGP
jgi:hypothetical protein